MIGMDLFVPKGFVNEQRLFHGTKSPHQIARNGFDMSYASMIYQYSDKQNFHPKFSLIGFGLKGEPMVPIFSVTVHEPKVQQKRGKLWGNLLFVYVFGSISIQNPKKSVTLYCKISFRIDRTTWWWSLFRRPVYKIKSILQS